MNPYGVEQLIDARMKALMAEAEAARLARVARWRHRRRGLGIARRITRRVDRRRARDLAY